MRSTGELWAEMIDRYRRELITKTELCEALALDRFELEQLLKYRGVYSGTVCLEDIAGDRRCFDRALR